MTAHKLCHTMRLPNAAAATVKILGKTPEPNEPPCAAIRELLVDLPMIAESV